MSLWPNNFNTKFLQSSTYLPHGRILGVNDDQNGIHVSQPCTDSTDQTLVCTVFVKCIIFN